MSTVTEFQITHFKKQVLGLNTILAFSIFFAITGPLRIFGTISNFLFILLSGLYVVLNMLKEGKKELSNFIEIQYILNKARKAFLGFAVSVVVIPFVRGFSINFILICIIILLGMILTAFFSFILTKRSGNYYIDEKNTNLFLTPRSMITYFLFIMIVGALSMLVLGAILLEPIIFKSNSVLRYIITSMFGVVEFTILIFIYNKSKSNIEDVKEEIS